jgi:dihydroxy-acid dehydratase
MKNADFLVLGGNLFDAALIKSSVIAKIPDAILSTPGNGNCLQGARSFEGRRIIAHIGDPLLNIDATCAGDRGVGPVGYRARPGW